MFPLLAALSQQQSSDDDAEQLCLPERSCLPAGIQILESITIELPIKRLTNQGGSWTGFSTVCKQRTPRRPPNAIYRE